MSECIAIGDVLVGDDQPCLVVAEIGINHNGDVGIARKLIDAAKAAGCGAVKFQKRTPEICVPRSQWNMVRETPWGMMSYIDYRRHIELGQEAFEEIDAYCRARDMLWFASPWDVPSVDFLSQFSLPCYKVASACLTDDELLHRIQETSMPVLLSTGMSTMGQISHAVEVLGPGNLVILHCTSSYPARNQELNLRMIKTLAREFNAPIGYSGHEVGIQASLAALTLGARVIERHVTLDRAMWGTDQAASLEPQGLVRLVRDIRVIESALGDGVKRVYDSELPIMQKLRRFEGTA